MSDVTCSVEGCERSTVARGLCSGHYQRVRKYGSPGSPDLRPSARHDSPLACSVDGCGRPVLVAARMLCQAHYKRWQRLGDPGANDVRPPSDGSITYRRAHEIVRNRRGAASCYPCSNCGAQADEWAYDHMDDRQMVMPLDALQHAGFPYSLDVNHYHPMCRSCHRTADLNRARSA